VVDLALNHLDLEKPVCESILAKVVRQSVTKLFLHVDEAFIETGKLIDSEAVWSCFSRLESFSDSFVRCCDQLRFVFDNWSYELLLSCLFS